MPWGSSIVWSRARHLPEVRAPIRSRKKQAEQALKSVPPRPPGSRTDRAIGSRCDRDQNKGGRAGWREGASHHPDHAQARELTDAELGAVRDREMVADK